MKIWIVERKWTYNGCSDDYSNVFNHDIDKIFLTEEKAINYIQSTIGSMIKQSEVIRAYQENLTIHGEFRCPGYDADGNFDSKRCENCIACDEEETFLCDIPSFEEIRNNKSIVYSDYRDVEQSFSYYERDIDD